jgi:lipoic acid synthetase
MIDLTKPERARKPDWLKVRLASGPSYEALKEKVRGHELHTVCQEAMCPNIGECWGAGTATIMILGDTCTRACNFCNVKTGSARGEVDWLEPKRVAEAVRDLGWKYLVLTAVDRDDLADGGAAIFAATVRAIHKLVPEAKVECLTGDFAGDLAALDAVLDAQPEVLAHNLETVPRLQSTVRDRRANFEQSLSILRHAKSSGRRRHLHDGPVSPADEAPSRSRRVRDAREIRALERRRAREGFPASRFEPAVAEFVSRGTGFHVNCQLRYHYR